MSTSGWVSDLNYVSDDASYMEAILAGPLLSLFFTCSLSTLAFSILIRPFVTRHGHTSWTRKQEEDRSKLNTTFVTLFVLYLSYLAGSGRSGLQQIIKGTDPKLNQLLDITPILRAGPSPPFWLSNRHIQFIPWMLQNELHRVGLLGGSLNMEYYNFTVKDCIKKTRGEDKILNCEYDDSMDQVVNVGAFPPFEDDSLPRDAPIIFVAPGLRCHSEDMPGQTVMRAAYGAGYRTVVFNRRGHHPDPQGPLLTSPRFNLFGDVDDMEQAYWHVKEKLAPPGTPMFLHGISSGCAVVVRALSLWDKRRELNPAMKTPGFIAAVAVTPGYDTSKVLLPSRFRWPYNALMNDAVKDHFVGLNAHVLGGYNSTAMEDALAAPDLQLFLNAAAPFAGYDDRHAYFDDTNPVKDLHDINTPIYVLNSVDDPCCNIDNLFETSPYEAHGGDTYADIVRRSQRGLVAITNGGSHCPFLDGGMRNMLARDPLGGWMLNSWADSSIVEWYGAALKVYGQERARMGREHEVENALDEAGDS